MANFDFLGNDFTSGFKQTTLDMTERDIEQLIDEQVTLEEEVSAPVTAPVSISIQTDPVTPVQYMNELKEGKDMGMQTVDTEVDLIHHHIRNPKLCESLRPPRPSIIIKSRRLVGTCTNCGSVEEVTKEAKLDKDKSRSLQKINNIQQKEIDRLTVELMNLKHKYLNDESICAGYSCTKLLYKDQEGFKVHFYHGGFTETVRYCTECNPGRKLNKFYSNINK